MREKIQVKNPPRLMLFVYDENKGHFRTTYVSSLKSGQNVYLVETTCGEDDATVLTSIYEGVYLKINRESFTKILPDIPSFGSDTTLNLLLSTNNCNLVSNLHDINWNSKNLIFNLWEPNSVSYHKPLSLYEERVCTSEQIQKLVTPAQPLKSEVMNILQADIYSEYVNAEIKYLCERFLRDSERLKTIEELINRMDEKPYVKNRLLELTAITQKKEWSLDEFDELLFKEEIIREAINNGNIGRLKTFLEQEKDPDFIVVGNGFYGPMSMLEFWLSHSPHYKEVCDLLIQFGADTTKAESMHEVLLTGLTKNPSDGFLDQ